MRRGEFIVFLVILVFFGSGIFSVAEAVSAPTLDAVIAISSCAIELDWTQPDPADRFDWKINFDNDGFPEGGWNTIPEINCPSGSEPCDLMWLREEFDPEHTHEYKLRAFKSGEGESDESNSLFDTLPAITDPPTQPSALQVTEWSDPYAGPAVLTWTPDSEPDYSGFRVFRSEWNGGSWSTYGALGPGGTFTLDEFNGASDEWSDAIDPDTAYKYKIQTYQTDEYCKTVDEITTDADPWVKFSTTFSDEFIVPKRPTGLTATEVSGSGYTQFTFSWDNVDNETEYELQVSIDGGNYSSYVYGQDIIESIQFTFGNDQTIDYRVRALWAAGDDSTHSAFFQGAQFVTGQLAPTDMEARITYTSSTGYGADVYLKWNDNAGYLRTARIYRRVVGGSWPGTPIAELGACATNPNPPNPAPPIKYYDMGVVLGEEYEYEIRFGIYNACGGSYQGESAASNIASVNLEILYILKGVAWAAQSGPEGVGWIKFNSADEGGSQSSVPYSVQIDKDGLVTGNAWADVVVGDPTSYGWLSFHPEDLLGCPSSPCKAEMNGAGELSGWAKFLAPEDFTVGESSWDGWVKLRGVTVASLDSPFSTLASLFDTSLFTKKPFSLFASLLDFTTAHAQSSYGVQLGTCVGKECPLSGQAWGSELVGWIGFNTDTCTDADCTVRADVVNESPQVANVQIAAGGNWCVEEPYYTVQWDFSDPDDGDLHEGAEVVFVDASITTFNGTGAAMSSIVNTPGSTYTRFTERFSDPLGYIATGKYDETDYLHTDTSYKPWVKTFDGFGWSNWVAGDAITTPTHYGPYVDFVWDPASPTKLLESATTTDVSIDRSIDEGTDCSSCSWLWEFTNTAPLVSNTSSTEILVMGSPVEIRLTVTDLAGTQCTLISTVDVTGKTESIKRRIFRER